MKDPRDTQTFDLLGSVPRKTGRPRLYVDNAARQKAYRQRLRERGHVPSTVPAPNGAQLALLPARDD